TGRTMPPPRVHPRIRRRVDCVLSTRGTRRTTAAAASGRALRSGEWSTSWAPCPSDEQQRPDADGDGHEDSRFAECVEAAKIHQNDIHDVMTMRQRRGGV